MGAILLAVLLLVAIAIAIAAGMRSGNGSSSEQSDRLLATTIIDQGNIIDRGFQQFDADPKTTDATPCYVPMWTTSDPTYYGLYDPQNASSVPEQFAPTAALVDKTQNWSESWTICWGYIYEPGVGNPNASYADFGITLADIRQGVCQQINQMLYHSTAISVSSENLSTWENNPSLIVLHPNNSNQPQACIQSSDGHYIFYDIIKPWG